MGRRHPTVSRMQRSRGAPDGCKYRARPAENQLLEFPSPRALLGNHAFIQNLMNNNSCRVTGN